MISICIPAYRHVSFTHEAAISILKQDVDIELVVLDDFHTLELTSENIYLVESLREYLNSDRRVKCFSNERLLPIQDNWNKAVHLCSRDYIKLIGADDRLIDGSLARISKMISAYPKIAFHGHLANVINETGVIIRQQRPYDNDLINQPITGIAALKSKLRQKVRFKEPACNFYQKKAWEEVGGYTKKYRFTFDIQFNTKLMYCYDSMLWNDYLVDLRRHSVSDGALLPAELAFENLTSLVDEILNKLNQSASKSDYLAAKGWIQYRLLELTAQRFKTQPMESIKFFVDNFNCIINNPVSLIWMAKLMSSKILFNDIQQ